MDAFVGWGVGGVGRVRDVELGPDYGHVCRLCRRSNPVLLVFFFFERGMYKDVGVRLQGLRKANLR